MDACFRVQVKWDIGGLKRKWMHFKKGSIQQKPKYLFLFWTTILLTNVLHMKHMDFTYEVINDPNANTSTHDWARDSNYKFKFCSNPCSKSIFNDDT
jgi:hypothetical protein